MPATTGGRPSSRGAGRSNVAPTRRPKVKPKPYVGIPSPAAAKQVGSQRALTKATRPTKVRPAPAVGIPSPAAAKKLGTQRKLVKAARHKRVTPRERRVIRKARRREELLRSVGASLGGKALHQRALTSQVERAGGGEAIVGALNTAAKKTATAAVTVLDQTTRPAEMIAGSTDYYAKLATGKTKFEPLGPLKGAVASGVTRENRTTFSDVLKTAGVKDKNVRTGVGLGLDIGLDPTTYASFGVGAAAKTGASVASKAAAKAGEKAAAEAAAKGASRKAAQKARSRAARRAYTKAPKNRGITVGVGGRRTSGRSSAWVLRKSGATRLHGRAHRRVHQGRVFNTRPPEISPVEWEALKAAGRERRGTIIGETRKTSRKATAVSKAMGGTHRRILPEREVAGGKRRIRPRRRRDAPEEVSKKVRDAIESKDYSKLTPAQRQAAHAFEGEQERLLKLRREAGEPAARYRKRTLDEQLAQHATEKMGARETAKGAVRPVKNPAVQALGKAEKRLRSELMKAEAKLNRTVREEARAEGRASALAGAYRQGQRRTGAKPEPGRTDLTRTQSERLMKAQGERITAQTRVDKLRGQLDELSGRQKGLPKLVEEPVPRGEIFGHMRQTGARLAKEPEGYAYRQAAFELDRTGKPVTPRYGHKGRKPTTTETDYRRGERATMARVREQRPGLFVEDLPTTLRVKGQKDALRAANTHYRRRVMGLGSKVSGKDRARPGKAWDEAGEGAFIEQDGLLKEVTADLRAYRDEDVVILKREIAEHANEAVSSGKRIPFLDAGTSKLKWLLTVPNPQYWMRNLYGGTYNVWRGGPSAASIGRNTPTAVRLNRRLRKGQRAEEQLGRRLKDARPVKVLPGGKTMPIDEFVQELERVNISGGGQTTELLGSEFRRRGVAQGAEDFPRLVAYVHFRRKGYTPAESSRRTLESQFDYGDLTKAERDVARRIFPFYTWRSRNVAFQTRMLAQRPGKLATTEKIRDSLAEAAGLPEGWQDALSEGQRQGVPVPTPFKIKIPGLGEQPLMLFPGIPVSDLNLLTLNPAAMGTQVASSVHPLLKSPIEFWTNYNFFWRDNIERKGGRWVAAPDRVIEQLPSPMKKALVDAEILKKGKDKWTGKWIWQWRGKTDYLAKLSPISSTAFMGATSGLSRQGQNSKLRALGWLTGTGPKPYDEKSGAYGVLMDEIKKLETRKEDMIELATHKKRGWDPVRNSGESGWNTKEYDRVLDRIEKLNEQRFKLEGRLGKKVRTPGIGVEADGGGGGGYAEEFDKYLREEEESGGYAEEFDKWLKEN